MKNFPVARLRILGKASQITLGPVGWHFEAQGMYTPAGLTDQ